MKFKKTEESVPEVDMTPMIDIVFQLIAFFMVITNFEQTQADERVKLPKNQLAKPPEVKRENVLTLNMGFERNKKGEKISENAVVFFNGEEVPLLKMRDRLVQESKFYAAINTPIDEVTVSIRADSEVPIGMVQELIQMCQQSGPSEGKPGFQRFALAARQKVE